MRRRTLGLISLAIGVVGLAVAAVVGSHIYQRNWYLSRVPPGVEVHRIIKIGSEGFCGAAIYKVDYQTAYRSLIAPDARAAWRETPIPLDRSTTEGMPYPRYPVGLTCAKDLGVDRQRLIARAASYPGSYYSTTRDGVFLLMPQEQWLVLSFFD